MKRVSLALALVLAVLAGMSATSTPAVRAEAAVVPPRFTPTTGVLFNNPDGTLAQQYVLLDNLGKAVDAAPPGSVIRFATYSFSYQPLVDQLLRAYARGVQVRLLIDSHSETPQILQLRKTLGTSTARTSYARTCTYGCMSSKPSFLHSKLYMFSTSGKAKQVVVISSANPARTGATGSWNNHYTIVGNETLYLANLRNFNDMLKDRTNTGYYRTASSGPYKVYFFPRGGKDRFSDTYYNVLSSVKCRGVAPGYGSNGRTVIKISMYRWTTLRRNLAQKLRELQGQGCLIQAVYPADTVEAPVVRELLAYNGPYGKIKLYNGRLDRDKDGELDLYVHSKYLIINGGYGSRNDVKAVYTGSPNFTSNSLRESNETALRIGIDSVYDAFDKNFNFMRDRYSIPVTKVPSVAAHRLDTSSADGSVARNADGTPATGTDDYWVSPDE
jgi:hypothetical protein